MHFWIDDAISEDFRIVQVNMCARTSRLGRIKEEKEKERKARKRERKENTLFQPSLIVFSFPPWSRLTRFSSIS